MMARRFSKVLLAIIALLCAVLPVSAQEGYGGTGPFKIEFTHQNLHGATYRSRFTIEGAVGIQPMGQGTGSDYAYLAGYADPNGTITVTMEWIECTDPDNDFQWKHVDIWMGNRLYNGDAMRDDDEQQFTRETKSFDNSCDKVVYTFKCSDYQLADPSVNEPILMVNASSGVQVGSSWSECLVYLKLTLDEKAGGGDGGLHVKEDHDASEEKGYKRYIIPGIIGSVILGGGAAAALTGRKRKEEDGGEEGGDEGGEGEQQEQQPDWLEMEIYKDFGNTLIVGDVAQTVNACIIRHAAEGGAEWGDEALTQRITISSVDNYLYVEEYGMVNGWKTAYVAAPECEEGEPPKEAIVQFQIASAEASYTNHPHFKILKQEIKFAQDNLTLPARYDKEVRLPFVVVGMNDGTAHVKVTITDENNAETKDYSVGGAVEWNAERRVYEVVIRDCCLDEKEDKGIPGNYVSYKIKIEASKDKGTVIKGELPLYRYYMGLVLQMEFDGDIHCYPEEYDPIHHNNGHDQKKFADGKTYVPAENVCYLKLYDWDEENHIVLVIDPKPEDLKFTLKELNDLGGIQSAYDDLYNTEQMQAGLNMMLPGMMGMGGMGGLSDMVTEAHNKVIDARQAEEQKMLAKQSMLDSIGLSLQAKWSSAGEGSLYYILSCRKGVLNPPNRFNAMMEVVASYKGKIYSYKRVVHLLSQPRRQFSSYEAKSAARKRDKELEDDLRQLENEIIFSGSLDLLSPLAEYVRLQLELYHEDYGYEERNVKAARTTFTHVLEGIQADEQEYALAADNVEKYTWKHIQTCTSMMESLPWWARMGVGVATWGGSDMAYMLIKIPLEMKKYVENGGNSRVGAFVVGAVIATETYIVEGVISLGISAATPLVKGTWRMAKGAWKGGRNGMVQGAKDSLKVMGTEYSTAFVSWAKGRVGWSNDSLEKMAWNKAKDLLDRVRKSGADKATRYSAAERYAMRQARQNLENLQTACEIYNANPTNVNLRMKNRIILECQADKATMMLMKNDKFISEIPLLKGVNFQRTRAQFNNGMLDIYRAVDMRVIQDIADRFGIPPESVKIMRTSSSNTMDLISGKTTTFDRDVTYYFIRDGKVHYVEQAFTEQCYAFRFREVATAKATGNGGWKIKFSELSPDDLAKWDKAHGADVRFKYDQTPIEDVLFHDESYGIDKDAMVNPDLHGEALKNPAKVRQAVMHKGMSRFKVAERMWNAAESLPKAERLSLQSKAVFEVNEGCRQMVKVFDILHHRDSQRHYITMIPEKMREAIKLLRDLPPAGKASVSEVSAGLDKLGLDFNSVVRAVGDLVEIVG